METIVKLVLNDYSSIIFTKGGRAFKVYHNLPSVEKCMELCGKNLNRPHFTCIRCQDKDVLTGRMPRVFEVTPLLIVVRKNRRFATAKNFLLKQVMRLIEVFLAN